MIAWIYPERALRKAISLSRAREGFMPLQELVVQLKARKNLLLTLFVCFWLLER